jgi:hypothetical protein
MSAAAPAPQEEVLPQLEQEFITPVLTVPFLALNPRLHPKQEVWQPAIQKAKTQITEMISSRKNFCPFVMFFILKLLSWK